MFACRQAFFFILLPHPFTIIIKCTCVHTQFIVRAVFYHYVYILAMQKLSAKFSFLFSFSFSSRFTSSRLRKCQLLYNSVSCYCHKAAIYITTCQHHTWILHNGSIVADFLQHVVLHIIMQTVKYFIWITTSSIDNLITTRNDGIFFFRRK